MPNATFIGTTFPSSTSFPQAVHQFMGIQYATVPRRFDLSQLVSYMTPNTTFDAQQPGPICVQSAFNRSDWKPTMNETCLYLNIWTPTLNQSANLPVMFYIHGGSFVSGAGSDPLVNGSYFAAESNVVYVTINYRLGAFGFLALDAIRNELKQKYNVSATGGATGFYDQKLALEWVQKHIGAFGGNPNSVTIQGESAGGLSVCAHLWSPQSAGLFHRAIIESGACNGPWGPQPQSLIKNATALALVQAKLFPANLTQLRELPAKQLRASIPRVFVGVDNFMVPVLPLIALATGVKINAVDVIVGVNSEDTLAPSALKNDLWPSKPSELARWMNAYFKNQTKVNTLLDTYYNQTSPITSIKGQFYAINTDTCLGCQSLYLTQGLTARGVNTYMYFFKGPAPPFLALHAAELPFVFNYPGAAPFLSIQWSPQLSLSMRKSFGNFGKTGVPNTIQTNGSAFTWNKFGSASIVTVFEKTLVVESSFDRMYRFGACSKFWKGISLVTQTNLCFASIKYAAIANASTSTNAPASSTSSTTSMSSTSSTSSNSSASGTTASGSGTPASKNSNSKGMNPGLIAAIVLGSICLVLGACIMYAQCRKQDTSKTSRLLAEDNAQNGIEATGSRANQYRPPQRGP